MVCDVLTLYGEVAAGLPKIEDDEPFLFTRDVLAEPPSTMTTDRMVLRGYQVPTNGHYLSDTVELLGTPDMMRAFACLLLAVLLHPLPGEVELRFTHPASNVKRIRIRLQHYGTDGEPLTTMRWSAAEPNYWASPLFFRYEVGTPVGYIGDRDARPLLVLTDESEVGGAGVEWMQHRDTAVGFGPDVALAYIARHILDAAISGHQLTVDLWDDSENGPLRQHSAELRLGFPDYPIYEDLVPPLPID
ncbi:MAG: hypothetical protein QOE76_3444 [Frankiales bacterium]|jgi:hypothetical protein|nr:hypothetical protein [Frankiales bacterium]